MSELTYDTFAGREGQIFEADVPGGPSRSFTLRSVVRQERVADRQPESFALTFHAGGELLPQATYVFRHEAIGEEPIFVVPIAEEPGGFLYEAVFTRIAEG
jgi:hypothetical protein